LRSTIETIGRVLRPHSPAGGNGHPAGGANDEQPLRAELFSLDQLESHAKSLAAWHVVLDGRAPRRADRLLARLAANELTLRSAYELVAEAVVRGRRITPAAEWFLDNYHLIEEQVRTARRHLPRGYSRELPRLTNGASAGDPRVYSIALELISHADGRVDVRNLTAFITAYQSVSPLRLGELWAIPIMLRLALLENLRRVVVRIAAGRRERERAGYWVGRMIDLAVKEPARVVLVLAEMVKEDPPLTTAFVSEFASRLQGQPPALIFAMTWLEQRLAERGQTVERVFQEASQSQAADQVSIGNSIGSLRSLDATEWRDFVEATSVVEHMLRNDPAGVYPAMDFGTRDQYRHAVEEIARLSPMSEIEAAGQAVELAAQAHAGNGHPGAGAGEAGPRTAHVGHYLIGRGRPALARAARMRTPPAQWARRLGRSVPLPIYLGSVALVTVAVTALILSWAALHGMSPWGRAWSGLLLMICASQLGVALVHWAATLLVKPRILPRMNFTGGIPPQHRTVVAVPTMLTDNAEIDDLLESLEVRFLANRGPNLSFALLSDFRDAPAETTPEDQALLQRTRDGIEALNAKYAAGEDRTETDDGADTRSALPGPFFLFHRARAWNAQEGVWMGRERKRGKLEDFNAALRGQTGRFHTVVGAVDLLDETRYVITLDSDTQLPRDSACKLAGTIAHPLNRPHFEPLLGRVTDGYGILQPRVGVSMSGAARSRFARLFSGEPGIDPYTRAVSDVYQDVFDEGSFVGKGIYDIDAFTQSVGDNLPDNRILSHDLLEGAYARAGLVSDVVLFEDFPSAYPADVSRRYRWIRGDWQIVPWLLPRVPAIAPGTSTPNPLSFLSRWKILDNVRRSLVPIALTLFLITGWLLPESALFYSLVVVALLLLPAIMAGASALARQPSDLPVAQHLHFVAHSFGRQALQELLALACLPYDAFISIEAIGRTTSRMVVSRRRLLEWRTARDAQRSARTGIEGYYRSMWILPLTALLATTAVVIIRPAALAVATPVIALWLLAPAVTSWLSRPLSARKSRLPQNDAAFLRAAARRTWRFFDTYVGPADNHLPPDNVQEDPPNGVAHRTSPTNIGLCLLANLAAYDFGYLTVSDLMARTGRTFASMDKLQRYRGHFYNWYDTRTLEPLRPLYVSSVDSGNLAGHLLTLAAGLNEIASLPIMPTSAFDGVGDTLDLFFEVAGRPDSATSQELIGRLNRLRESLRSAPRTLSAMRRLLQGLAASAGELLTSLRAHSGQELDAWATALEQQSSHALDELNHLAPWLEIPSPSTAAETSRAVPSGELRELLEALDVVPTLAQLARIESTLLPRIDRLLSDGARPDAETARLTGLHAAVILAAERATGRLSELQQLALRSRELADLDYEFLYDRTRKLLAIGYNVSDRRLDASFYDLLASEARLASFIAIAQGKLPQEHWFSLGRLVTTTGGRPALLSWSGSIFEYLMPLLVMPTYDRTLLDETCRAVVQRQIDYGRERGVPWGISESGYNKTDAQLNYQYRAFGVPGLGFKRGLADDLVIAPYATAMALMVDPQSACINLRRLDREGRQGEFGFYEAIDYTPTRLKPDQASATVRSYMAHHQGMSFLSFAYLLLDRPMQRRFESDPAFRATDLLLQERVPNAPSIYPHPAEVSEARDNTPSDTQANYRIFKTPQTPVPEVHLLSNGRYHVAVTAGGGGYSRWRDLAVTRWHEDATRDCWGSFCYIRDVQSGAFWSTAHQPTLKRADAYEAIYSQGKAEFHRRDGDIETHVEISVSPEDDIELRRISITNRGRTRRTIELTSFAEVVLAPPAADAAHPAFSNLFVQTQLVRDRQAILVTRRPRSAGERPPWMMHLMTVHGTAIGAATYETDRAQFIGRGRSVIDPVAMHHPALYDSEGSVLDPVVAIRNTVVIEPDETVRVHLVTGISDTREGAAGLVEKYHDRHLADRVFELAWTHSQVVLRQLDASEADTHVFGRLTGSIIYSNPLLRAPASVISRNRQGQSGLWGYGISGDLPIVLLRIGNQSHIDLARQLVQAHAYWRVKGLAVDLVIWNEDQSGYRQVLQDQIMAMIASSSGASLVDKPGGIFVRRAEQMSEEDRVLMQAVARIILTDTAGTLPEQTDRRAPAEVPVPRFTRVRARRAEIPIAVEVPRRELAAFNGIGGFTPDGREYVITTTVESPTPAPWVNVLANPWFGTVVSESGGAYTWCENAHSYRLTPWHNDPISDASGEAFYLRDEESGRVWSPTPLPVRGPMPYTTRHGFGYSIFEYTEGGISSVLTTYVATDAPVKFVVLRLRNASGKARRVSVTALFELVLGDRRARNLPHIVTEVDPKTGALFARNPYNGEFADRVVFLDVSDPLRTVTGDRVEFLGRNGSPADPACLRRTRLSGRVGAGLDPCAATQVVIDLADGQEREIVFTFGSGRDLNDARNLVNRFRGTIPARAALEGVWGFWNRTLGTVHVQTPDPTVNFLANGWLLYQVIACRLWARSGFYQSGGAFGFRDQLQDAMALVHAQPSILREQLLRGAAHQFREGDVQHWWHPPLGRGVRTGISDDYLWLPYATCRYVAALGDTGVLDEKISFIDGRPINPGEDSYYDLPVRSNESATLYEHCVRSIKRGLRFGDHGLPLMGTGDWNDGMNLVGEHGKGESVWLAFFLYDVLTQFTHLARRHNDDAFADLCTTQAATLRQNIELHAWDGQWYRRAYFDNGQPLGSDSNPECKIDSLPQSWSVLSKSGDADRSAVAMDSLYAKLVRKDLGIIQLFDPPFDHSDLDPGYVKGYVPGVRENGGQYTHAAVWSVMAFAAANDPTRAWELFDFINPVRHGDSPSAIGTYKVEPYVIAADVYTNPQHAGRGGWTWYTGSAGWMYRLITESLLGLRLEVDRLTFAPCLRPGWQLLQIHYRYRETFYHITLNRAAGGNSILHITLDGAQLPDNILPLSDDRKDHNVTVEIG
jgi:cellobiose phosphorylase